MALHTTRNKPQTKIVLLQSRFRFPSPRLTETNLEKGGHRALIPIKDGF